jgi:hypothetical protein
VTYKLPTTWIRQHDYDTLLDAVLDVYATLEKADSEWHFGAINKQPWRQTRAVKEHLTRARTILAQLDLHGHYEFERNRNKLLADDDAECRHCGSTEHLHIDHIMHRSRSGGPELSNLHILCMSCNSSKRDRTMQEWLSSNAPRARLSTKDVS